MLRKVHRSLPVFETQVHPVLRPRPDEGRWSLVSIPRVSHCVTLSESLLTCLGLCFLIRKETPPQAGVRVRHREGWVTGRVAQ